MKCLFCKQDTSNPKFCNRSCAAKYNNIHCPKRKPQGKCKTCDKPIINKRTYCNSCLPKQYVYYKTPIDMTLEEAIYKSHHKSSAYALVRSRARSVAKTLKWNKCKNCGYDKHIEIAHIKPIKDFDTKTLVSIINNPDNLLPLCPNCHWEFDSGLLKLRGS